MTTNLRNLQESLQAYLLTGDTTIAKDIINPAGDQIDTRLAIYRDSYYLCLLNNLKKEFALLEQLLGEQAFEEIGIAYINAYPSQYFTINDFGQRFPDFLRTTSPYNQQPPLSELAELILALNNTLISADTPTITPSDLATIPPHDWGNLTFQTHPSVKLLTQQTNAYEIWQALIQNKQPPKISTQSAQKIPSEGWRVGGFPAARSLRARQGAAATGPRATEAKPLLPHLNLLIWRKELTPYSNILTQQSAQLLQTLQSQKTFAEACETLTQSIPEEEIPQYVINQLTNWLNQGIFAAINHQAKKT